MRGSIRTRRTKAGAKRYDVIFRAAGKQRWRTFQKKRDADRFLAETVTKVHDGSFQEVRPEFMSRVFQAWLQHLETRVKMGEVKASTAATYRCGVQVHLGPMLGAYRSDELTPLLMQKKWRAPMADKIAAGRMAKKSYNNLHTLLRAILTWAREPAQRYLAHDPLVGQKRLKLKRGNADFLQEDDIKALLEAAADVPTENAVVHLGLFAGLRRGEIFALRWADIEWGDGKIGGRVHVRRSIYRGVVTSPKSTKSERLVDVPQRVLDVLEEQRVSSPALGTGYVFRTGTGTPLDPGSWYKRTFRQLCYRAGLRGSINLHSLRHTYASLLLRQGESLKYVSDQLGHASIQTTCDVYGHVLESQSQDAMARLNRLIPVAGVRRELRVVRSI